MPRQMALLDPLRGSSAMNPPPPERAEGDEEEEEEEERWSTIPPELLGEVVRRLESSDGQWPLRKSLVSCACVCRRWRQVTTGVVGSPRDTGMITFAASLKQVGFLFQEPFMLLQISTFPPLYKNWGRCLCDSACFPRRAAQGDWDDHLRCFPRAGRFLMSRALYASPNFYFPASA
ncbi:hypothetical protein BHM03_00043349 [Ensete ventricosum]|nr:hypothetical protein BHM03_00043349 [Ensete ventricosum]